jgi:uncharacterized protein YgiM (DUF1202 family)
VTHEEIHRRKIGRACGLFVLLCGVFSVAADPQALIVTVPVANMYSAPTAESDVVSQAIYGSNVVVIEGKPAWAKVETSDHYSGWISLDQARQLSSSGPRYANSGKVLQVSTLSANLYREPDVTAHRPVLTIPFETQLEFLAEGKGEDAGWLQVRLPDNQLAWIQAGDVASNTQPLSIHIPGAGVPVLDSIAPASRRCC